MTPSPPSTSASPANATMRNLTSFLLTLITFLSIHHHCHPNNVAVAAADPSTFSSSSSSHQSSQQQSIQCASNAWFQSNNQQHTNSQQKKLVQTITPDKINDGYCDCPLDGLDEPNTGACSGSMEGMWAGIPPVYEGVAALSALEGSSSSSSSSAAAAAAAAAYFVCPQQPSLKLALSRVNDGICDCCDGADESTTSSSSSKQCQDNCEIILAESRAAHAKLQQNYNIGSTQRLQSISQFQTWKNGIDNQLMNMKEKSLEPMEEKRLKLNQELFESKVEWGKEWGRVVRGADVLGRDDLRGIVGLLPSTGGNENSGGAENVHMGIRELTSLLISLCQITGESSSQFVSNGRCLPLERAAVDLGIMWEFSEGGRLPNLVFLNTDSRDGNIVVADRVLLRLEGKDTSSNGSGRTSTSGSGNSASQKNNKGSSGGSSKKERDVPEYDITDDYYGDDYHDSPDYYSYDDDELPEEEEEETVAEAAASTTDEGEGRIHWKREREERDPRKPLMAGRRPPQENVDSSEDEEIVRLLLQSVPLTKSRTLFTTHAKNLLQFSPPSQTLEDEGSAEQDQQRQEEEGEEWEKSSTQDETDNDTTTTTTSIDPMAMQMVKSTVSKRMSSISRGETSAKSAAQFLASLSKTHPGGEDEGNTNLNTYNIQTILQNLTILVFYHGKVSSEDVAELTYGLAKDFGGLDDKESCVAPWSGMCPPRTVPLGGEESTSTLFPPSFIVEAANKRCLEREDVMDDAVVAACTATTVVDESNFPNSIPNGYYNYYEPKSRDASDILTSLFTPLDELHTIPNNIRDLIIQKQNTENEKKSLQTAIDKLEKQRGDISRYGTDGELYSLRDTCHSVESGKYEYEVCIFGKATQRDIGQSGGTHLGNWHSYSLDEESGMRTLKWDKGTKCWNGPVRSAEVEVTCGAETRLLTADEPETCRYVFTMESPIGCDEKFRVGNLL